MPLASRRSEPNRPPALVTGASGMIGGEVAAQLAAAGHRVRCLLRASSGPPAIRHPNIEVLRADLGDRSAIAAALRGVQWVFHVAGYLHAGAPFNAGEDYAPYRAANVDLTGRMLAACVDTGVRRFVFTSTTGVYRPGAASPIGEGQSAGAVVRLRALQGGSGRPGARLRWGAG